MWTKSLKKGKKSTKELRKKMKDKKTKNILNRDGERYFGAF